MWDTAASALKWLIDTLLKRRSDLLARDREKRLQVAAYLEQVAMIIESTLTDYKAGKLPHRAYAEAVALERSFEKVLYQVYDHDDLEQRSEVHEYQAAFREAIHLMDGTDEQVNLQLPAEPLSRDGQLLLADLESAGGQFRGVAVTLRAMA